MAVSYASPIVTYLLLKEGGRQVLLMSIEPT